MGRRVFEMPDEGIIKEKPVLCYVKGLECCLTCRNWEARRNDNGSPDYLSAPCSHNGGETASAHKCAAFIHNNDDCLSITQKLAKI